jgi:hypothetical protein
MILSYAHLVIRNIQRTNTGILHWCTHSSTLSLQFLKTGLRYSTYVLNKVAIRSISVEILWELQNRLFRDCPYLVYFPKVDLSYLHALCMSMSVRLCVCESSLFTFKYLNQSLRNLVCVLCHMTPPQRRTS